MATILSDKQIKDLIGTVIVNGDENLVNPNSIELRLGKHVYFYSTEEECELSDGQFLKIKPGETILFSSYEILDFSKETVSLFFAESSLIGLITPTTTMMREGIAQVTTKVDAGFKGCLNWSLRSGSAKDIIIQFKEPLFKLTVFRLVGDENPTVNYGERNKDSYQNATQLHFSKRTIPANIPKSKCVESTFGSIDPKKTLKEAGYPFNFIGTELTELQGKFEIVSKDVMLIKQEFTNKTNELSIKIDQETKALKDKIEETKTTLLDKVQSYFSDNFNKIVSVLIAVGIMLYGGVNFLQSQKVNSQTISFVSILGGLGILAIYFLIGKKKENKP